jgi:hypothetical protein
MKLLSILLILTAGAMAADVTFPIKFNSSELDSVMVVIYDDGVVTDTVILGNGTPASDTLPVDTNLTLDTESTWRLCYRWFWTGDVDVDTMGLPACETFVGPSALGVGGDGSDTLQYVAFDSAQDTAVSSVTVSVRNSLGTLIRRGTTNGSGIVSPVITLVEGDNYTTTAVDPPGYVWNPDSIISFSAGTDTIWGYSFIPPTASIDSVGRTLVWGLVSDANENVANVRFLKVTATLPVGTNNSCDSALVPDRVVSTRVNAWGIWQMYLTPSSCLDDNDYSIQVQGMEAVNVTVTDSTSQRVFF